jgi:hypothetical protein
MIPRPFCDLDCQSLARSSREFAYDSIAWHDQYISSGKQYGCLQIEDRELFLQSERSRAQCTLYQLRNRAGASHISNETFICARAKERHTLRKQKQRLGHAAAASAVKQQRKQSKKTNASSTVS